MEIDKFVNNFLIFFLFAILSSILYFHFASQTFAFQKYFSDSIEPKIKTLNKSLNNFNNVFTNNCIDLTFTKLCVLETVATNSTDLLANAVNGIRNIIVGIVNVPLRIVVFILLFNMIIINFISLFIAIIGIIPQLFGILNVFSSFSWVGVIILIALLMVIVYLIWKLLEYIHGLV
jgi:hypothetical protein